MECVDRLEVLSSRLESPGQLYEALATVVLRCVLDQEGVTLACEPIEGNAKLGARLATVLEGSHHSSPLLSSWGRPALLAVTAQVNPSPGFHSEAIRAEAAVFEKLLGLATASVRPGRSVFTTCYAIRGEVVHSPLALPTGSLRDGTLGECQVRVAAWVRTGAEDPELLLLAIDELVWSSPTHATVRAGFLGRAAFGDLVVEPHPTGSGYRVDLRYTTDVVE
ncbi:MAG TPA: hypothetical protein VMK42_12065 [Anaeromyxobacteraceae bacterium]|nr:hypothetical protein [Anaeromyxobacteraceae bacterium]